MRIVTYIDQDGNYIYVYEPAGFMDWNPWYTFGALVVTVVISRIVRGEWLWEQGRPRKTEGVERPKETTSWEERRQQRLKALNDKGNLIASEVGVEFVGVSIDWDVDDRLRFRTVEGDTMVAVDADELRWKLSLGVEEH